MALDAIVIGAILTIVGGILIIAGFLSPSLHVGHIIGVRTPWTDSSDRSRTRTNRAGAVCFLLLGLLTFSLGMAGVPNAHLVGVGGLIAVTVLLMPYSYLEWRRDLARKTRT
jgi:uncharacterized membrane protein